MASNIKIAVDAMGGDNSPKKIIDGILVNSRERYQYYLRGISALTNCSQYAIPKGKISSLKSYLLLCSRQADFPSPAPNHMYAPGFFSNI